MLVRHSDYMYHLGHMFYVWVLCIHMLPHVDKKKDHARMVAVVFQWDLFVYIRLILGWAEFYIKGI